MMTKIKKIVAVMVMTICVFAVAGCGEEKNTEAEDLEIDISNAQLISDDIVAALESEAAFNKLNDYQRGDGYVLFEVSPEGVENIGGAFADKMNENIGTYNELKQRTAEYKGNYFWAEVSLYQGKIKIYRDKYRVEQIYTK